MSLPCHKRLVLRAVVLGVTCVTIAGCEREARRFPAHAAPGGGGSYTGNAYAISQGEQLFLHFNCVGCHAHGGGASGPALMDAEWIYGSDSASIFTTIVNGRPNGMPSFRKKLTDQQVWQLAAYVRSLSGQERKDNRPGRLEGMQVRSSEQNTQTRPPHSGGIPPGSISP